MSERRFAYYRRLSARARAEYRRSDAITTLALARPDDARSWAEAIAQGLRADDRHAVQRACTGLSRQLCRDLGVRHAPVRVLARRPADAHSELHGLYVRDEDDRVLIRVWMRTAAHERVVAFRTFLRTLLHELCHHFDYERLELRESFHTRGFFQRESSLVRQLVGAASTSERERERADASPQLSLPGLGRASDRRT